LLPQPRQGEYKLLDLTFQSRKRYINILQISVSTSHFQIKGSLRDLWYRKDSHRSFDFVSSPFDNLRVAAINKLPEVAPTC
jgi:hypothetical protein